MVPDLTIQHAAKPILWNGTVGNATFVVSVLSTLSHTSCVGFFSISVEGLEVATVDFVLRIGRKRRRVGAMRSRVRRHKRGFASYASEDRGGLRSGVRHVQSRATARSLR
jgi:hypothetical protein